MFSCHHLSFSYAKRPIFNDLNFELPKRGIVGIFGHNGCGKSTLLKILSGVLVAQEGDFKIAGQSILDARKKITKAIRQKSGILLQESSSDDKLSVLDNLVFFAQLFGVAPRDLSLRVAEMLEHANLVEQQGILLKKLSGGTKRRCELYRSFLHRPRFVFLDEPTAGLDFHECTRFFAFARDYVDKEGALIVFSSHQAEDFSLCDVAMLLHGGRIIAQDSLEALLTKHEGSHLEVELKEELAESWLLKTGALFGAQQQLRENKFLSARLNASSIEQCLNTSLFSSPAVKSFMIRAPTLSDVYEELINYRQKIS